MKKIFFTILLLFAGSFAFAQNSNPGKPVLSTAERKDTVLTSNSAAPQLQSSAPAADGIKANKGSASSPSSATPVLSEGTIPKRD